MLIFPLFYEVLHKYFSLDKQRYMNSLSVVHKDTVHNYCKLYVTCGLDLFIITDTHKSLAELGSLVLRVFLGGGNRLPTGDKSFCLPYMKQKMKKYILYRD